MLFEVASLSTFLLDDTAIENDQYSSTVDFARSKLILRSELFFIRINARKIFSTKLFNHTLYKVLQSDLYCKVKKIDQLACLNTIRNNF